MKPNRVFLLVLLLTGMFYPLSSYHKINLSLSSADSLSPCIALDSKGRITVVWVEMDWYTKGSADILYVLYENEQWSEPKETMSQLYDSRYPHLVMSPRGRLHLTYADGKDDTSRDIFYRSFSFEEKLWSNIQRVYLNESHSSCPKIEVSKEGQIHVLWVRHYQEIDNSDVVMSSKDEAERWPDEFENVSQYKKSSVNHPSFKVKKGSVYACWMDNRNGIWDIFYNEKVGGKWNIPVSIGYNDEKHFPSLALDKENNIHIVYSTKEGNTFYIKRVNQMWKAPLLISTAFSPVGATDLKLFKDNTLHAVWKQKIKSGISIFYSRATSDGDWLKPIKVAEGKEADSPNLALDDDGNAHIVWEDLGMNGHKDIFYAKVTPHGTKPIAFFIGSTESEIVPFTVDFDASSSSPGEGIILSYWWDFGDGSEMVQGQRISHNFEIPGDFVVKLYVTNSLLLAGIQSKVIHILPGPFPPINIRVKKTEDGGLFYREKINALSWGEDPKNKERVKIFLYNIYRKLKSQEDTQFKKIGQVDGSTYKYVDRNFLFAEERDLYTYAVSAIDDQGREGPKGLAVWSR